MARAVLAASCVVAGVLASPAQAADPDPRDDASPWGIASGAEWSREFPRFNPMLRDAGVRWLRLFPEWQTIQPRQGEWDWKLADAMVQDARSNQIRLVGGLWFFARWASADGGTRKGPIKDMQYWRDYVTGVTSRYKDDVKYWEVWNEFNGSFYQGPNKVQEYADLVVATYEAAKKVDPGLQVGMSVANFDVGFLDAAIKAGAKDHFDFVCVHPYENLDALKSGSEMGYLALAGNLREMLKANGQNPDMPLWITEIGFHAPVKPDPERDAQQANMLVKAYVLSIAQGFDKIFWFEARGPAYGPGQDLGIIRADWSPRPSYTALQTLTRELGQAPRYLGWLDLGQGGYGFLFEGEGGPVLAAWSPAGKEHKTTFSSDVRLIDPAGQTTSLAAGAELVLNETPVLIRDLPAAAVEQARQNADKPYPWGGDYANATTVVCRLGAVIAEEGLKLLSPERTEVVNFLTETCRKPDFSTGAGHYLHFRVDPQFAPYGTKELQITIVAKRVAPDKNAGMTFAYESPNGYVGTKTWWTIPAEDKWHEHTFTIKDANFVGQWGWNFRIDALNSPNTFLVKEVRVTKPKAAE